MVLPYISVAEFDAYPNYLDLDDLVPGGNRAQQVAELTNVLISASTAMDRYCRMPLGPHVASDTVMARLATGTYEAVVRLKHRPIQRIRSVTLSAFAVPGAPPISVDPSTVYMLDQMLHIPAGGVPLGVHGRLLANVVYEAGYPVTTLAAPGTAGVASVLVEDPTSIVPGAELRIWDPGVEEFVQVAASYTPGSMTVPLAAPLMGAHAGGVSIDALPADVHEAVVLWTMGVLARPTSAGDEDAFSDTTGPGPTTTGHDPRRGGHGLIAGAKELLSDGGYVRAA